MPSQVLGGGGLHLLSVLRYDGLLTLEVLSVEVLTQIGIGEDGIARIGFVDGLEKQPTTDEAFLVGLCCSTRRRREVLRAVLELDPVDADPSIALTGDHEVADTLRCVFERSSHREPLVAEVATEHRRHPCWRLRLHGHIDLGDDLAVGTLLANIERGIVGSLSGNHQITIGETTEVHIVVFDPATLRRKRRLETAEGIDGIDELGGDIAAGSTVAVDLDLLGSLVDTHTTQGLLHLLNRAVGIEGDLLDADTTTLVIAR